MNKIWNFIVKLLLSQYKIKIEFKFINLIIKKIVINKILIHTQNKKFDHDK